MRYGALLSFVASAGVADAQNAPKAPRPIQDNSFLIEEAYNQEKRVVQHIGTFERNRGGPSVFQLTQEWPLGGLRHQLSFTIPVIWGGDAADAGRTSLGDILLNYRFQLRGDGDAIVAVAPRLSVILPTNGDDRAPGFETNIPTSISLARQLVAHMNAGATFMESPPTTLGPSSNITTITLGQSLVWLPHPNLNVLLEALWARTEFSRGLDGGETSATLSPGVRGAINLASGMQIVPGLAVPFGIGPSRGDRSVFLYLSVEHSF